MIRYVALEHKEKPEYSPLLEKYHKFLVDDCLIGRYFWKTGGLRALVKPLFSGRLLREEISSWSKNSRGSWSGILQQIVPGTTRLGT
jgi:hypothetical protein